MELTMQTICQRRGDPNHDLGFENGKFHYLSYIGKIPELDGDYIRTDEESYPVYGMHLMVISLQQHSAQAAHLIDKLCYGKPWLLVQWVVDRGRMIEHVGFGGGRWRDYGVNFDVKFALVGNTFYQDLAKEYLEGLQDGD